MAYRTKSVQCAAVLCYQLGSERLLDLRVLSDGTAQFVFDDPDGSAKAISDVLFNSTFAVADAFALLQSFVQCKKALVAALREFRERRANG